MYHYCSITFDFHKFSLSIFHQSEAITLHGAVNEANMDLVRKKNLRSFSQTKRRCYNNLLQLNDSTKQQRETPELITEMLDQFHEVFEYPK